MVCHVKDREVLYIGVRQASADRWVVRVQHHSNGKGDDTQPWYWHEQAFPDKARALAYGAGVAYMARVHSGDATKETIEVTRERA